MKRDPRLDNPDPMYLIHTLSNEIASINGAFEMRRRLNPHHPEKDIEYETRHVMKILREKFVRMKQVYAENKEELETRPNLSEQESALLQHLDRLITEDMEMAFGLI